MGGRKLEKVLYIMLHYYHRHRESCYSCMIPRALTACNGHVWDPAGAQSMVTSTMTILEYS